MSKTSAPRAGLKSASSRAPSLAAALLACAFFWGAAAARAQELGDQEVAFRPAVSGVVLPANGIVYESGASDYLAQPWDTILLQGVSSDAGIAFEAARGDGQGGWSAWRPMDVKRYPNGRFWARLTLAAGAGQVRIRAVDASNNLKSKVEVFDVEVFDSQRRAASSGGGAAPMDFAQGGGTKPVVHARSEWGAKPPKEDYEPDVPWRLTLHHTDGLQTRTEAESIQELRFIQDFHQNGRGWNDIAYHFLIDAQGNIWEGRPLGALGAHTLHNNDGNIGISLMATHHPPKSDPVTPAELDALISLGRWLVARYNIDPSTLKGHRDYKSTDCPGDLAYALLPKLRAAFAQPQGTAGAVAAAPRRPAVKRFKAPPSAAAPRRWD